MRQGSSIRRAKSFILIFSVIYSIFESNILYLTPIITVLIPYQFMRNKEVTDQSTLENQKTLSRLLLFNFICIELVSLTTQSGNFVTFNISVTMLIYFVYFKMLSSNEKKVLAFKNNPKVVYDKMKLKIDTLENIYQKGLNEMESTDDEKVKKSMQAKLDKLKIKINASKQQLDMIENIIDSSENNK
ncbi:hypothetical protein [Paraclostridium bifermentans]|jgi:hypothetical protein|uniref:Uncharacterized protein n=2 Tax=Paraclostridium bifermentans TaxID=1490 RepID=A0A1X2JL26_PARBF|nr:hypothetical protein [Paraclostridium bifermentans]MDV8112693.1 hypothetical protein [Bacillus sp. BAU-SS-2023]EQK42854.1 hypothetical protein C672_1798 [[Clostridium] bifermentans ATCC 638] [Paraclostridium bifermentans ATCC 638 = DSM 14991]MBN8047223.1 hypothetical protein [Paraclostridium bifermentans]MBS6507996.1 hypothetical protein [Paraclostridium bifermentans]MBU5286702.1 hypothetical protein [Paraclostridium bifermentans]